MSADSNNKGRAYEYAWINVLYENLKLIRKTRLENNSSFIANQKAWECLDKDMQKLLYYSASSAVSTVLELEPQITENSDDELLLYFQKDGAGIQGDVRDIVIKRNDIEWEIGLSIKHNHEAIKHSRLSHKLDFGKEWFDIPCSDEYWKEVTPIFNYLKEEKRKGSKWSDLTDKENGIYVPLLQAFIREISRAYSVNSEIPKRMIEYLVGKNDYYKIVSYDKKYLTMIHTFNMHGTLNHPSKFKISAIHVPIISLPTELIALKFKTGSSNTIELYLNNGWQLGFRIHNASTKIEPSLKFDIQFIGMPTSILNIECKWKQK